MTNDSKRFFRKQLGECVDHSRSHSHLAATPPRIAPETHNKLMRQFVRYSYSLMFLKTIFMQYALLLLLLECQIKRENIIK